MSSANDGLAWQRLCIVIIWLVIALVSAGFAVGVIGVVLEFW